MNKGGKNGMFKKFIERIIKAEDYDEALKIFYEKNGIEAAYQKGKITRDERETLLRLMVSRKDGREEHGHMQIGTTDCKKDELKACPFCGNAPTISTDAGYYRISCAYCDIHFYLGAGAKGKIRERVIDAWNRRANAE